MILLTFIVYYVSLIALTGISLLTNIFTHTDYEDFDNATLFAVFPIDEGQDPVISVELAIPIVDDEIDEAEEQVFIIFLEVVNGTNLDKLNIPDNRKISVGRIRDDESEYVDLTF